jgi:hypothetical protein
MLKNNVFDIGWKKHDRQSEALDLICDFIRQKNPRCLPLYTYGHISDVMFLNIL